MGIIKNLGERIEKVAEYMSEVTEKIVELEEENKALREKYIKAITELQELEYDLCIGDDGERLVSMDRILEIAKAEKEGRCFVLPCNPSDTTVYQLRGKKHARGKGVSERHLSCAMVWGNGNYALYHQGEEPCLKRDFGKKWFLSEEEANNAVE